MFGMGPWELIIVFGIILLLFGGKRLPGIATGLGQAVRNFKTALNEPTTEESNHKQLNENSETKNRNQTQA